MWKKEIGDCRIFICCKKLKDRAMLNFGNFLGYYLHNVQFGVRMKG